MFRLALLLALGLVTAGSHAQAKTIDCYCTDKSGERIELGEMLCMFVDGKSFMAQCQMSLNVPMWRRLNDGCLIGSKDTTPLQSTALEAPHAG